MRTLRVKKRHMRSHERKHIENFFAILASMSTQTFSRLFDYVALGFRIQVEIKL
jgi:hypothetical protein